MTTIITPMRYLLASLVWIILQYTSLAYAAGVPILMHPAKPLAPQHYTDAQGYQRLISSHLGTPLILYFWATSCGHCVRELPDVSQFALTYYPKGLRIIPMTQDDINAQDLRAFYTRHEVQLPVTFDINQRAFRTNHLRGTPHVLFVNRQGNVIASHSGRLDWNHAKTRAFVDTYMLR